MITSGHSQQCWTYTSSGNIFYCCGEGRAKPFSVNHSYINICKKNTYRAAKQGAVGEAGGVEGGGAAEYVHSAVGEVADGDVLAADVAPAHHDRLALLPLDREAVLVVEGGRKHGGFRRDFLFLRNSHIQLLGPD